MLFSKFAKFIKVNIKKYNFIRKMKKFLIVGQVRRLDDYQRQKEIQQLKLFKIMESIVFSKKIISVKIIDYKINNRLFCTKIYKHL